jgi:hypothetical protein
VNLWHFGRWCITVEYIKYITHYCCMHENDSNFRRKHFLNKFTKTGFFHLRNPNSSQELLIILWYTYLYGGTDSTHRMMLMIWSAMPYLNFIPSSATSSNRHDCTILYIVLLCLWWIFFHMYTNLINNMPFWCACVSLTLC